MKANHRHISVSLTAFLILSLALPQASAQTFFRNFSVRDGISNNTVKALAFDLDGYLWVGTENGLNRYDGHSFRKFDESAADSLVCYSEYINTLLCDSGGTLWVGTDGGVFSKAYGDTVLKPLRMTDSDGNIHAGAVLSMSMDHAHRLWISTSSSGIFCLNTLTGQLRHYGLTAEGERLTYVPQVYSDSEGNVWSVLRGRSHLLRYDEVRDAFSCFDSENIFPDVLCICEDSFNNLWMGTWDAGLVKYNPRTRKSVRVMTDPGKVLHVHSVLEYSRNVIAVGSDNGLCLWDDASGEYVIHKHQESSLNSLSNNYVYPLVKDREGGLWIGTYYGGVNYLSPFARHFRHYGSDGQKHSLSGNIVSAMCEDPDRRIWIGTDDGGVSCYDTESGTYLDLDRMGLGWLAGMNVHALCSSEDEIWVGTYDGGLHRINTRTGSARRYDRGNPSEYADCSSCYSLLADTRDSLWVGTMYGVLSYDRERDVFRNRISGISLVIDICEDLYGDLWIATQGSGLYHYRRSDGSFVQHSMKSGDLPCDQINCLLAGTGNEILIGTTKGIVRHSLSDGSFNPIDASLPSDNVCYMVKNQGRIWVSTATGLAYCDISDGSWHDFSSVNEGNASAYLIGSGLISSGNELYLGTTRGVDVIPLTRRFSNDTKPQIRIAGLRSGDRVDYGPDEIASLVKNQSRVRLRTTDRGVSFLLYSTSFVNPSRNRFSYMMEGLDDDWSVSSDASVVYGKMPPGKYTFHVRGTNNDGVWDDGETSLRLTVRAPWLTGRFSIFLYILTFFLLTFFCIVNYYRHKDMVRKERVADLQRQKEKDMYQEKLNFFTMVAHEIRTPASLILGPLEKALELEQSDLMKQNLETISRNCHSMLDMINQLLDYKKVENGAFTIRRTVFNFTEAVGDVLSGYAVTADSRGIGFESSFDGVPASLNVDMDRGALERILNNLLTNALKYCKSSIVVRCSYDAGGDRVGISIKDDGIGISESNVANIFKPFFRENEFNQTGTGIGLFLVKHLVDSHGGTVSVRSEKGAGSEFLVELPALRSEGRNPLTGAELTDMRHDEHRSDPTESGRDCILVVEDNPELRNFLETDLSDAYDVLAARNGSEAVEILRRSKVNLIITDVMMPDMDGLELCRYVHSHATVAHIPIILLTAKTDADTRMEGLESRADAFMEKPFSMKMLRTQARNLLQSREMLRKKFSSYFLAPYEEGAAADRSAPADPFWEKLNGFMEANIDNPDYSVNRLAEDMCMSRTKLFAHFREVSDKTPMELMQHYRLKKAASLFLSGNRKVSDVAYMVGFKDPSYFTKCFLKHFGMTPLTFIQRAQPDGS